MQNYRSRLFAGRAGIHVDFHANRHFDDLWCFPGHSKSPSRAGRFSPSSGKLLRFEKFASEIFLFAGEFILWCAAKYLIKSQFSFNKLNYINRL